MHAVEYLFSHSPLDYVLWLAGHVYTSDRDSICLNKEST